MAKYDPRHHRLLPAWSWVQLSVTMLLLFYMFAHAQQIGVPGVYIYGSFTVLSVFAYTELMDRNRFALAWEGAKNLFLLLWIILTGDWFGISSTFQPAKYVILGYSVVSTLVVAGFTITNRRGKELRARHTHASATPRGSAEPRVTITSV